MIMHIEFHDRNGIVKMATLKDAKVTMSMLDQIVGWIEKQEGRKVWLNPCNPQQARILQTPAWIKSYDSAAVLTQWLGGVPKGEPIENFVPSE